MANPNNGTFEISEPPRQSNVLSDRDPLISKGPLEGGVFKGLIQPCLGEFFGMSLFVFLGTLCAHNQDIISLSLVNGLVLAILMAAVAPISGGHLNPAVTFGVLLSGGIDVVRAFFYLISQLVGAILGAALTKGVMHAGNYKTIYGGSTMLPEHTSVGQAILCEMLITAILVTVVLLAVVDDEWRQPDTAPISVGLAMLVGIMAAGDISGASMNPARSFGPAVVTSSVSSAQWTYHYVFWVGPALGSILATLCYRLFLAGPTKRILDF